MAVWQKPDHFAHACLHRPEQIEGDVPRNRTKGGMAILTYDSDFPIHVPSTSQIWAVHPGIEPSVLADSAAALLCHILLAAPHVFITLS